MVFPLAKEVPVDRQVASDPSQMYFEKDKPEPPVSAVARVMVGLEVYQLAEALLAEVVGTVLSMFAPLDTVPLGLVQFPDQSQTLAAPERVQV